MNYAAISQAILGIQPDYDGLRIDPCIPPQWDGFAVKREFRGATYEITVANPNGVSKGIDSIAVDGQPLNDNLLPVFGDGQAHKVQVVMG